MELHEYQAKALLRNFHIPLPSHYLLEKEVMKNILSSIDVDSAYIRPQIYGKSIEAFEKKAFSKEEIAACVHEFFIKRVVTTKSGPEGFVVKKVLVIPFFTIDKTFFFRVEVTPQGSVRVYVRDGKNEFFEEVFEGKKLFQFQIFRLVSLLNISRQHKNTFVSIVDAMVKAFFMYDATFLEIDPLVITEENTVLASYVRMNIDDAALFRQKEIASYIDVEQRPEREKKIDSSFPYVLQQGTIGCIATGMGVGELMAYALRKRGGDIAGIMDIGDVFFEKNLLLAIEAMDRDPAVSLIFMNLFTGLTDGEKIISAVLDKKLTQKKMYIRLEGVNASGGIRLAEGQNTMCVMRTIEEVVYNKEKKCLF